MSLSARAEIGRNPADVFKRGDGWRACYDRAKNRYLGQFWRTSREGQVRFTYEIPQKVFVSLYPKAKSSQIESRIETGKLIVRFEDSLLGTSLTKMGDEGEEAIDDASSF